MPMNNRQIKLLNKLLSGRSTSYELTPLGNQP
jgi:hypothetical protein